MVPTGHVLAGPTVHARVGLTFVVIDVTVRATPARVAGTFVANAKENVICRGYHLGKLYAVPISLMSRVLTR